ncbi:MAG: hypothetical protein ACRCYU_04135 [Nocardioides sp.]
MNRKPGQQPKGDRAAITVRVPRTHYQALAESARAEGLTLSDYLNLVISQAHGLDVPSYVHRASERAQEALPISA